jgi:hypothetical protein
MAAAVSLDLKSQAECLPGVPVDVSYQKCFTDVVVNLAQIARKYNVDRSDSARLEFTFASRTESDGAAERTYLMIRNLPERVHTSILETNVRFERAALEQRLEPADLLAREAMKEFDRKISSARPEARKSFTALDAANKFIWIARDHAYCERWRDLVNSADSKTDYVTYKRWLIDTKRV